MAVHVHLHDNRAKAKDYGTSEGAKKAAASRGRGGSPKPQFQQALARTVKNIKAERPQKPKDPEKEYQARLKRLAGGEASMKRQGKSPKPQFQQALSRTVKNIKAERPAKPKDPEKEYQARIKRLARDDSVSRFFDSAGLAPDLSNKEESKPDTDLSGIPASKKGGEYRSGPFNNQVHPK